MLPIRNDSLEQVEPHVLVDRIRAGDKTAESELVRRYSRPILTMLRQRTGDRHRAEDLHQETFFVVLQRLRTAGIEDPTRIAAFLHQTAVNLLIGDIRKESRRMTQADTDRVLLQPDNRSDQLEALIREQADRAVRTSIQELSNARDREVLYRFYVLQQEKPIVCKAMQLSFVHFDRVISRARARFRQLIDQKRLAPSVAEQRND